MDNQRLGVTKNNISMSIETSLLSLEIIQEYTKEEKLMNIAERISSSPDGRLQQTIENESALEPKSLKSDRECKAIRVSVIISPIKRIRNIVKDRRIETEESSCSSEAKRNKDFESSSVTIIQNDSKKISIHIPRIMPEEITRVQNIQLLCPLLLACFQMNR
ncbi:hypothetical protein AVEN_168557-1 [Araneus ventricosus]|uniref:Uncharacterized protein n=1 Tax=Araneus ventricosus TaxID=182803 RepID=A0A4Y2SYA7_ARAVE|nr:hypothetical protein AVEN_168557-1 [Araneus ventricosus]